MRRPATVDDIAEILDHLENVPKFSHLLRTNPGLRESLREIGHESAEKFGTPRSEIERSLRATLHTLLKGR